MAITWKFQISKPTLSHVCIIEIWSNAGVYNDLRDQLSFYPNLINNDKISWTPSDVALINRITWQELKDRHTELREDLALVYENTPIQDFIDFPELYGTGPWVNPFSLDYIENINFASVELADTAMSKYYNNFVVAFHPAWQNEFADVSNTLVDDALYDENGVKIKDGLLKQNLT